MGSEQTLTKAYLDTKIVMFELTRTEIEWYQGRKNKSVQESTAS